LQYAISWYAATTIGHPAPWSRGDPSIMLVSPLTMDRDGTRVSMVCGS